MSCIVVSAARSSKDVRPLLLRRQGTQRARRRISVEIGWTSATETMVREALTFPIDNSSDHRSADLESIHPEHILTTRRRRDHVEAGTTLIVIERYGASRRW